MCAINKKKIQRTPGRLSQAMSWMKHTLAWMDETGAVRLVYKPVVIKFSERKLLVFDVECWAASLPTSTKY
jgi:hypothetical protein